MMNQKTISSFIHQFWKQLLSRLVGSQVILDDVQSWSLLTKGLDDDAWTSADLAGFALFVDFAQSRPLAQLLAAVDADQRDLMLAAQGGDELFVLRLVAALSQDAQHGLTSRKRKQCHWLLFGLRKVEQQADSPRWAESAAADFIRAQRSPLILFQLTCPTLCKPDGCRERVRRTRVISSGLLAKPCWGPLGHQDWLARSLHCN